MAGDFEVNIDVKDLELLLIPNIRSAFLDVFLDFSLGVWLRLKKKKDVKKNKVSLSTFHSPLRGGKLFQNYSVLKVKFSEEWLFYLFLLPDIVSLIETYSDLWKQAPTDD